MKKYLHQPFFITSLLSISILFLVIATYTFGWTTPSQTPPGGNLNSPINAGSSNQAKTGYLSVGTSTLPSFPLDVAGVIRIGGFASAPSGSNGALYYNTATNKFQGYQNGSWADLGGGSLWTQAGSDIYYITGNVGIGKTGPGTKLEVNGQIKTGGNYFNVVSWNYNGTPTNGVKIKTNLPYTNGSQMPTIIIEGYDFGSGNTIGISLVWYIYSGAFMSYKASSWGNTAPTIKLANENNLVTIFLDWRPYYGRFTVRAYAQGRSETASWFTDWTVVDEAAGTTNQVTVPYVNNFPGTVNFAGGIWNSSGNVGIGTTAPGEKLEVSGNIKLSGASPTYKITNVATPTASSDVATKGYVDAGTSLPGFLCPSQIESSDRAVATLASAITTCRNLGNSWRLPTAEELSCFIGSAGVSSSYLWTRTPYYGYSGSWVVVRLTDGGWYGRGYTDSYAFRCVR